MNINQAGENKDMVDKFLTSLDIVERNLAYDSYKTALKDYLNIEAMLGGKHASAIFPGAGFSNRGRLMKEPAEALAKLKIMIPDEVGAGVAGPMHAH
jgi:hypothetical protein